MKKEFLIFLTIVTLLGFFVIKIEAKEVNMTKLTEKEWQEKLTSDQFYILRKKGTERAFTGEYWNNKKVGTYSCVACGTELFSSKAKFESGTGWPSFWEDINDNTVTKEDNTFFMKRVEVLCKTCEGHLGHVFPDGPKPTGQRYCINSAALHFKKN